MSLQLAITNSLILRFAVKTIMKVEGVDVALPIINSSSRLLSTAMLALLASSFLGQVAET